jgi:hypothetical protein
MQSPQVQALLPQLLLGVGEWAATAGVVRKQRRDLGVLAPATQEVANGALGDAQPSSDGEAGQAFLVESQDALTQVRGESPWHRASNNQGIGQTRHPELPILANGKTLCREPAAKHSVASQSRAGPWAPQQASRLHHGQRGYAQRGRINGPPLYRRGRVGA